MRASIDAPFDPAAPSERAHTRGISQAWAAPPRPKRHRRPARRPLLPALAILCAPALAITALVAFGSIGDRSESGLGSLEAANGLQGSAAPSPAPEPAPSRKSEEELDEATERAARTSGRERPVRRSAPSPSGCAQPSAGTRASVSSCPETAPLPTGGFDPRPSSKGPGSLEPASGGSGSSGSGSSGSGSSGSGSDPDDSGSGVSGSGVSGSGTTSGSGNP